MARVAGCAKSAWPLLAMPVTLPAHRPHATIARPPHRRHIAVTSPVTSTLQVWKDGAAEGLGWIHLRFPTAGGEAWEPPLTGWHVDGHVERLDTLQAASM